MTKCDGAERQRLSDSGGLPGRLPGRQGGALVTGASGFVGMALTRALVVRGVDVRGVIRHPSKRDILPHGVAPIVAELNGAQGIWNDCLIGVDTVFHLAARVHVLQDREADSARAFQETNLAGTRHLAERAWSAGVRRFVFVSTVKVHGEQSGSGLAFSEHDEPMPVGPYAESKLMAEQALWEVASRGGMDVCVVRPPLVYGPGVRANFLRLMRLARLPVPIPLGGLENRRSLVFVGNLVEALLTCATHPDAANRTFLVSDGEDVTTSELVARLRHAIGRRASLLPFPQSLLRLALRAMGREADALRLLGSLQVDSALIQEALGWRPPYSLDDGLRITMEAASRS